MDTVVQDRADRYKTQLSQAHITKLNENYGINAEKTSQFISVKAGNIPSYFNKSNIEGGGILIQYNPSAPERNKIVRLRLDNPIEDKQKVGKKIRYLSPPGQPNALFVPEGLNMADKNEYIVITEGEFKAMSLWQRGISAVALSGIFGWRKGSDIDGIKEDDDEALIPDLNQSWTDKKFILLYDSDITPEHSGWMAFPRLAEQLYALGADEVKIVTLPVLSSKPAGQKIGADDFVLTIEHQGGEGTKELVRLFEKAPVYRPLSKGIDQFIAARLRPEAPKDAILDALAVTMSRSGVEFQSKLDALIKGTEAKRAWKADVTKRLSEIKRLQAPKVCKQVKIPLDPVYEEYIAGLSGSDYSIDENGILWRGQENRAQKIANFVIKINKEIIIDEGSLDESRRFVEIAGVGQGGTVMTPKILPINEFATTSTLLTTFGSRCIMEPINKAEDYLRHAAQILGRDAQKQTKYGHTGWRNINGEWVYLHAGGAIGNTDHSIEMVEGRVDFSSYTLPNESCDTKEAVQSSLRFLDLAPYDITIPLLAMIFTAPLLEIFKQAGISVGFSLFVTGESGSQKSTMSALALCHYGEFTRTTLPASFTGTTNSVERLGYVLKDTVMVVDDRYPTDSAKEQDQMTSMFTRLVREYANRTGRTRCNPDGTLKQSFPPRGLAIFTMELSASGLSTIARGLEVCFKKGMVSLERLTVAQNDSGLLAQSMRGYLEWLAGQFIDVSHRFGTEFITEREYYIDGSGHGQLPEHLAALTLGMKMFLEYAVSVEGLSHDDATKIMTAARHSLKQLGNHQSAEVIGESPVELMDSILAEMFASQTVILKDISGDTHPPRAELVGWSKPTSYFNSYHHKETSLHIGWADESYYYF